MRSVLFVSFVLILVLAFARPAAAVQSINVTGYTDDGGWHPADSSFTIPVGATLHVRVWVDLYSCGPVTVDWGDGSAPQTRDYGGSFALQWDHVYAAEGSYQITATDCTSSESRTISVGTGLGLGPLDPSSPLFAPALFGLILGLIALAMANARPPLPAAGLVGPGKPAWWKPLRPGIPASMAQHVVSLRDIPLGAPRQEPPAIQMVPGRPTDPFQKMHCPGCGADLGYTVAGWFCRSPTCPLIGAARTQFPQIGQAYGPPPFAPPA